jgi:hypothetical protein
MMNEELNLAISGANDLKTIIYNLRSGEVMKKFELGIRTSSILYNLGTFLLVGGKRTFRLIDQKKLEQVYVDWSGFDFDCEFAKDMKLISDNEKSFLYLGGQNSNKITKVMLPKMVTKMSKKRSFILLTNSSDE